MRVEFEPELGDDPTHWQFALYRPTGVHVLAVGIRRGPGADLAIRIRESPLLAR